MAPQPGLEPGTHGLTVVKITTLFNVKARPHSLTLVETCQICHVSYFMGYNYFGKKLRLFFHNPETRWEHDNTKKDKEFQSCVMKIQLLIYGPMGL